MLDFLERQETVEIEIKNLPLCLQFLSLSSRSLVEILQTVGFTRRALNPRNIKTRHKIKHSKMEEKHLI